MTTFSTGPTKSWRKRQPMPDSSEGDYRQPYARAEASFDRPTYDHTSSYTKTKYPSAYPPTYYSSSEVELTSDYRVAQQEDAIPLRPWNQVPTPRPVATPSKWRRPWFCWFVSLVQLSVFIGQLGHAWKLTGTPIQIKPTFNPLIGPSVYNSINMGARFPACMKVIDGITDVVTGWPCPNTTTIAQQSGCTLATLCGNGAQAGQQPKQWWRFITPIFLHAGIIHIAFNLLLQLQLGTQVELEIGTVIFAPIYLLCGIAGFLAGGNFAGDGITSVGASGALFGILALNLLTLLYHWKQIHKPMKSLVYIIIDMIISFVLGLLPGVDNFSHIGGWLFGMMLGVALLRSPDSLDRRQNPYCPLDATKDQPSSSGESQKMRFLEARKPMWYALVLLRVVCLVLATVSFVLLIKNFYQTSPSKCTWCKYLSCLPVSNWCSIGDLTTTTTSN